MKTDGWARAVIFYLGYGVVGLSVAWSLSYLFPAAMTDRAFAKGLIELVMVFAIPILIGIGWIVVFVFTVAWQMLKIWVARNLKSES